MNKLKYYLLIILINTVSLVRAQQAEYLTYNWDENPNYVISDQDKELDIVGLKDYYIVEYGFENDEEFYQYNLIHKVLWLNSDEKIEQFNRIYLPYGANSEILRSQARVISPSGIIKELDESKIFTATDETSNSTTKYYALEGIEKGGYIEYFYIIKKSPDYKGSYVRLQKDYKIIDSKLELFSPENLVFEMYSVNSTQKRISLDDKSGKQHLVMHYSNLEKIEEEELSAPAAMVNAVIYKLVRNIATGGTDFGSYATVSKNIFNYVFEELDKKNRVRISKFLKNIDINKDDEEPAKIRKLESYIKKNIYVTELGGEQLSNLEYVLENKAANVSGILKLFANTLQELEIPFEIVLTCDRSQMKFDKDIESLSFLQDYLLYFPSTGKYVAPANPENRYGFPPFELTDTYGLFIQKVTLGDLNSGIGRVKYINSPEAEESIDEMNYKISFDPDDISETLIEYDHSIGGYNASFIHPFTNLINPEDKDEFYEEFIKGMGDDVTIISKKIINESPENFGVKPLRVTADLSSSSFINKAGNKYLFKLGELIGPQIEMYQEKARQLPLENLFRKTYLRTIEITIPEGYIVKNLDDINISNKYHDGDRDVMYFVSSYEKIDNKIIVIANEIYDQNILPVEQYEDYRTVINSAADFNKVTLILEPLE